MAQRLIIVSVFALLLASCGGGESETAESGTSPQSPDTSAAINSDGGAPGNAGIDIGSLGPPPDAAPQTAVAVVDGVEFVFDAAELGVARCEVESDRVAINIGQSQDWFAFVATPAGETWSVGPSFGLEDGPQYEGLIPGSRIEVVGERVTFQGEIVIKANPTDFDSWTRTVGSVSANCEGG